MAAEHGHELHGGARPALMWDLLDMIVIVCTITILGMLAELAIQAWGKRRREGVRYDLTPEARAALARHDGVPVAGTIPQPAAQPADTQN